MEDTDNRRPIYTCYMDTSKAFDMVDHKELLCTLRAQGLRGDTWHLFHDAYKDIHSVVKWDGEVSRNFHEGQGIRQGGTSSAGAFNINSDALLHRIEPHPDGYKIGCINIGAVMVADDIALISGSRNGIQALVNIAEQDAAERK